MPKMLPVNMSVEGVHVAAGLPSSHQMPVVPSADELDNWTTGHRRITASVSAPQRTLASRSGMWREVFSTTR